MIKKGHFFRSALYLRTMMVTLLVCFSVQLNAQTEEIPDYDTTAVDSLELDRPLYPGKLSKEDKKTIEKSEVQVEQQQFTPDPTKAVIYSALIPGWGQIYNRKYWKLPIVAGGFFGLTYAISWNGRYYTDYSLAYQDLMDDNPNTKSYMNFLPSNIKEEDLTASYMEWLESALKRKKDFYRRNRDLSIICTVGLYLLCMVDAYVDAQLYHFSITPDLSLRPTIITSNQGRGNRSSEYPALQLSFQF